MKIAVADNCHGKFSKDITDHWISRGHEVRFESGASEHLTQWADLYYVDFWDNNIHYLWKLYNDDPDHNRTEDWDNNKKPRIVVRAIDWEVWCGLARDQRIIDWVDDVIVIAPHIETELRKHADFGNKIHLIRPGVNLDKFTLKQKKNDGFQLGMVLGDMWFPKNHMAGLDIFTMLYRRDNRWRLHIRGQHEPGEYWPVMYEQYLISRKIRDVVTLYPRVEDMNQWYEGIDILLHPGMKEAFCYAVGEAAAKGIPPVINEFYGSRDIWKDMNLYQTHEDAIAAISFAQRRPFVPELFRGIIEENHNVKTMLKEYDELLGT